MIIVYYLINIVSSEILTPDNVWVIGITQELSTRDYYLVLYYDIHPILSRLVRITNMAFIQYDDFYEIEEIGSGGYATVYTAKYNKYRENWCITERVVLKEF